MIFCPRIVIKAEGNIYRWVLKWEPKLEWELRTNFSPTSYIAILNWAIHIISNLKFILLLHLRSTLTPVMCRHTTVAVQSNHCRCTITPPSTSYHLTAATMTLEIQICSSSLLLLSDHIPYSLLYYHATVAILPCHPRYTTMPLSFHTPSHHYSLRVITPLQPSHHHTITTLPNLLCHLCHNFRIYFFFSSSLWLHIFCSSVTYLPPFCH